MHTSNIVYLDWPSYFSVYNWVTGKGYTCYLWLRVLFGRKGSSGLVTGCGGPRVFLVTWRGWGGIWMRSLFSLFPFFREYQHGCVHHSQTTPSAPSHPLRHPRTGVAPTHLWLLTDWFYLSQYWSQKLHSKFQSVPLLMKYINTMIY